MTFSDKGAHDLYSRINVSGRGFPIGEKGQDTVEALENDGYTIIHTYSDNLIEATKDRWMYLIGSDGLRRNAWAVGLWKTRGSDVEDYLDNPVNVWTTRG